MRKLGEPPELYLPSMARACHLAAEQHGGAVLDAVHALHAARLRLIIELQEGLPQHGLDLDVSASPLLFELLATYSFLKENQQAVAAVLELPGGGWRQRQSSAVSLLLEDCAAAMRWCIEKEKWFHKAYWRYALSFICWTPLVLCIQLHWHA
jgi:hypothetical protein